VERFRREHGEAPLINVPENVLLPGDQRWMQVMDRLDRPPVLLHHSGDSSLLDVLLQQNDVAVVGTRAASAHGEAVAEDLDRTLASMGWPLMSVLAEGIDAAAHRGCLDGEVVRWRFWGLRWSASTHDTMRHFRQKSVGKVFS
jgi:DNA processing protein